MISVIEAQILASRLRIAITLFALNMPLKVYEYGVADYLLKPIKLERFIRAVNKVVEQFNVSNETEEVTAGLLSKSIFIKEDQVNYQVKFNDILFIEAYGNYLKVHTQNKVYVTRETMHDMERKLPDDLFLRIHKSFIVALPRVDSISGNRVFINQQEIPVGEMYKLMLNKKLKSF